MLVLASSSPRRAMLLREGGYPFETVKASVSEELPDDMGAKTGVRELAVRKAQAGLTQWLDQGGNVQDVIMGADTMVVLDARILGKPETQAEAEAMLQSLSGRTHVVLTGVALMNGSGRLVADVVETVVRFHELTMDDIKTYVASGEAMDKAGAYGIQGEAGKFVESFEGSLTNVIGLPMEYLSEYLGAWGIEHINIASREVDNGKYTFEGFTRGSSTP
jgi:septum formation protein